MNGNTVVNKTSNPLHVSVRGNSLNITPQIKTDSNGNYVPNDTLTAGNPYGVFFSFAKTDKYGNAIPTKPPYTLTVYNATTNAVVLNSLSVPADNYSFQNAILNTSGVYRFEFTDAS